MSTTSFSTLYDRIALDVPGCPEMLIEMALLQTARDFFTRVHVWRHTASVWPIPERSCYSIAVPAKSVIGDIISVTYKGVEIPGTNETELSAMSNSWRTATGSTISHYLQPQLGELQLYPIPDNTVNEENSISVHMSLIPALDATSIDTAIMTRYDTLLIDGALAYLLARPEQRWTNKPMAMERELWYRNAINNAAIDSMRNNVKSELAVSMRPFA